MDRQPEGSSCASSTCSSRQPSGENNNSGGVVSGGVSSGVANLTGTAIHQVSGGADVPQTNSCRSVTGKRSLQSLRHPLLTPTQNVSLSTDSDDCGIFISDPVTLPKQSTEATDVSSGGDRRRPSASDISRRAPANLKILRNIVADSGIDTSYCSGNESSVSAAATNANTDNKIPDKDDPSSEAGQKKNNNNKKNDDDIPVSFLIVRLSPTKPPCVAVRLAFLGGTPGSVRQTVS